MYEVYMYVYMHISHLGKRKFARIQETLTEAQMQKLCEARTTTEDIISNGDSDMKAKQRKHRMLRPTLSRYFTNRATAAGANKPLLTSLNKRSAAAAAAEHDIVEPAETPPTTPSQKVSHTLAASTAITRSVMEEAMALSQKEARAEAFDCGFAELSEKSTAERLSIAVLSDLLRLAPCNQMLCHQCRAGRHNMWFSNVFNKELRALLAKPPVKSLSSLPIDTVC